MEAYAGGLKAMKAAQQAQPLSREELEDVMDQLQDVSVCVCVCVCVCMCIMCMQVYLTSVYAFVHVVTGYVWMILGQFFQRSVKKHSLLKRILHLWTF